MSNKYRVVKNLNQEGVASFHIKIRHLLFLWKDFYYKIHSDTFFRPSFDTRLEAEYVVQRLEDWSM